MVLIKWLRRVKVQQRSRLIVVLQIRVRTLVLGRLKQRTGFLKPDENETKTRIRSRIRSRRELRTHNSGLTRLTWNFKLNLGMRR